MRLFKPTEHQQSLWLNCQNDAVSILYNNPVCFKIIGTFDIPALSSAFKEILRIHPALTSNYFIQNAQCLCIERKHNHLLQITTMSVEKFKKFQHYFNDRLFDLKHEPLIKAHLVKTDQYFYLLINIHHLAADAWSVNLIMKSLNSCYKKILDGKNTNSVVKKITDDNYINYLLLRSKENKQQTINSGIQFWVSYLKNCPHKHSLPSPLKPQLQKGFKRSLLTLSRQDNKLIANYSKLENSSPFILLETLTALAISKESQSYDVVLCTPCNGRLSYETHSMVGYFSNLTCIRNIFSSQLSLLETIRRNRSTILDVFSNQEFSFVQVVNAIKPKRLNSRNPISQILFSFQSNSETDLSIAGCEITRIDHVKTSSPFDMEINMIKQDSGYELGFLWNKELIDEQSILNIKSSIIRLLAQLRKELKREHSPDLQLQSLVDTV